jgi:hypothetical protein
MDSLSFQDLMKEQMKELEMMLARSTIEVFSVCFHLTENVG